MRQTERGPTALPSNVAGTNLARARRRDTASFHDRLQAVARGATAAMACALVCPAQRAQAPRLGNIS